MAPTSHGPWDPTPTRDAGGSPDAARCIAPADLTAFALRDVGAALPAARRAAISRHLLRCPSCRATLDREERVLERLGGFAASPTWEDDLAAADLAQTARVRARRRGALVGTAAAAALAAILFAWPTGPSSIRERGDGGVTAGAGLVRLSLDAALTPVVPVATLSREAEAALLRAQSPDGRWHATTGDDRHDVGATGLAVLALARAHPDAIRAATAGSVARAVADGVRWLSAHVGDPSREAGSRRDRAVAAEALRAVYAATGETSLRSTLDRTLRFVAHRGPGGREGRDGDADSSDLRATLASASNVLAFVSATPAR